MKRILISWNATGNDFIYKNDEVIGVNPNGTHGEFYQYLAEQYDEHYILNTSSREKPDEKLDMLFTYLSRQRKCLVKPIYMGIEDPISIQELKDKLLKMLLSLREHHIEAYISPGTPAMQTAWYLLGAEFKFNLKLFFVRAPKFRKEIIPLREYVRAKRSNLFESLILSEELKQVQVAKNVDVLLLPSNQEAFDRADIIARVGDSTTLILGESGTGKEVVAKYIHEASDRKSKRMLSINCSAFQDDLLESRLFGHVEGAFTGAIDTVDGAFQKAKGGTLFLDEIGDISKKMQQTLLRAIETKRVSKVGSYTAEKVNIRIVAATNANLWQKVIDGDFRQDLYFRLAVAEIDLLPFRSYQREDKEKLVRHFLKIFSKKYRRRKLKVSKEVWSLIHSYDFPGNIRELIHLIEKWYHFSKDTVRVKDFVSKPVDSLRTSLKLDDVEAEHIRKVIQLYPYSKKQAYQALGIQYNTFEKKLKKYNLIFGKQNTT